MSRTAFAEVTEFTTTVDNIICNYTFIRKYVDNVGGPWIVTFVNHHSMSQMYM